MAKEYATTQGSKKGYNLYIYKEGEEIPGTGVLHLIDKENEVKPLD